MLASLRKFKQNCVFTLGSILLSFFHCQMEWSRLKTRGVSPGPRAECTGVLCNDKWYIAGGESNGTSISLSILCFQRKNNLLSFNPGAQEISTLIRNDFGLNNFHAALKSTVDKLYW